MRVDAEMGGASHPSRSNQLAATIAWKAPFSNRDRRVSSDRRADLFGIDRAQPSEQFAVGHADGLLRSTCRRYGDDHHTQPGCLSDFVVLTFPIQAHAPLFRFAQNVVNLPVGQFKLTGQHPEKDPVVKTIFDR